MMSGMLIIIDGSMRNRGMDETCGKPRGRVAILDGGVSAGSVATDEGTD